MSMPPSSNSQALATLVHLAKRAREAKEDSELGFILVNETIALAHYQQAALWIKDTGVKALSGVVTPEDNAPYVLWLQRLFTHMAQQQDLSPQILNASNVPAHLLEEWQAWLPPCGVWVPLPALGKRFRGGAFLLARDQEWSAGELILLAEWAGLWTQSRALMSASSLLGDKIWSHLGKPLQAPAHHKDWRDRLRWQLRQRRAQAVIAMCVLAFFPVRLTVLAPAELIPLKPAVIRAPLDGVVERVLVMPNQNVAQDTALFEFDRTSIKNRLSVAQHTLATVQAEYRQKSQQALFDANSKSQLAVLQSQIAEKETEVAYLEKLHERSVLTAPRAGVVLFGDPTEWEGRPVVTGEKVMMVADEHAVEVEAWLSPADMIDLPEHATLKLYLNADPLDSIDAQVHYIAHEAIERPDGKYAYRVRATLTDKSNQPRVGLKGTAKLQGHWAILGYWVLRRPLAAVRAWIGV